MPPLTCGFGHHFQDLGHSFLLNGPPSRQVTYLFSFFISYFLSVILLILFGAGWKVHLFLHLILCKFCLMCIFSIALPLAPLNARAIIVKQTFLTISWIPRDDADSTLRYSIDCVRCKSLQDKECRGLCSQNVKFQPGGDKIYAVNVSVFGLQSGSFYLFRVYSVNGLNQEEKVRDKWNFATVYVQTKGKKS